MKRREYFVYAKKIKITTFIQQFVSSLSLLVTVAPFWRASDGCKVRMLFSVISNAWICIFYTFLWVYTYIQVYFKSEFVYCQTSLTKSEMNHLRKHPKFWTISLLGKRSKIIDDATCWQERIQIKNALRYNTSNCNSGKLWLDQAMTQTKSFWLFI